MKLVRFTRDGATRVGKLVDGHVVDLSAISNAGDSMRILLTVLHERREEIEHASAPSYPVEEVRLEAPIHDPQKFLAIGMNYEAHAREAAAAGIATPTSQLWFNKQVSSITGPFDPITLPNISDMLDYEAELGFVIGTRCRHVTAADALSVIAGYLVVNDVSVRDWQMRSPTMTLGKSFDTHGPIGPWITTSDEVANPDDLEITLTVDGERRQHARTDDLIYGIAQQVEYLSTVMTLFPGDVIATGTPSGVGAATRTWLTAGQVVRVEIEQLGAIENVVTPE